MVKVPDYKIDFSRKMSEIDFDGEPITSERYLGLSEELSFDQDFLKTSTIDELQAFLNKYVNSETVNEIHEEAVETEEAIETPVKSEKIDKIKEVSKATKEKAVKAAKPASDVEEELEEEEPEEEVESSSDDEDIDIGINDIAY